MPLFPVPESPNDGKAYNRQDRGWVEDEAAGEYVVDEVNNTYMLTGSKQAIIDEQSLGIGSVFVFGGGGNLSVANVAGSQTFVPTGAIGGGPPAMTADSGYPGNATVISILGGYDNVCNQSGAAILGASHSQVKYDAGGHACIFGGSSNTIMAPRSSIINGRLCQITGGSQYTTILGGSENQVDASDETVVIGQDNQIAAGCDVSFVHGRSNRVTKSSSIYGSGIKTLSGPFAEYSGGATFGQESDGVVIKVASSMRRSDASAVNQTTLFEAQAGKVYSGQCRVRIICQEDGTPAGDNSSLYGYATWDFDFGYKFNQLTGRGELWNATLYQEASNPIIIPVATRDTITGPKVEVRITGGNLLCRFTGVDGKTLQWYASYELTSTYIG